MSGVMSGHLDNSIDRIIVTGDQGVDPRKFVALV